MDSKKAREILNVTYYFTEEELKYNYRLLVLKHHPDKNNNSEESNEKCKIINEAYHYLKNKKNFEMKEEVEYEDCTYENIFKNFVNGIGKKLKQQNKDVTINVLIKMIMDDSETLWLSLFEKLDKESANNIFDIICTYHHVFHICADKFVHLTEIMRKKMENDDIIIINVSLDDLLSNNNIYVLEHENKKYYIPLWHNELYYKLDEKRDLIVKCNIILPSHIYIDNFNDIYVDIKMKIIDLLEREKLEFKLGNKNFQVLSRNVSIKRKQIVKLEDNGIPTINNKNIYDTTLLSNVYVKLELY